MHQRVPKEYAPDRGFEEAPFGISSRLDVQTRYPSALFKPRRAEMRSNTFMHSHA
ncbi:hypothetical protein BRPE64_ECDS00430 (plasmid) [Caballeronia insecticola]|uniref:Uncharacterized protein n=1 Tax=Caballeronia insecticola TaxID=758793 RepID=R4X4F1_9BURK|nr:hypothetical protein BRPE64_ECDS00430 [Caballeronia insecticola]